MAEMIRQSVRIDSGVVVAGQSLHIAIDVHARADALNRQQPLALVCLPGGGMNRRYFDLRAGDLQAADGDDSYSFAAQMTRRGFIVIAVDHPGIGDSDRPQDGYALTPNVIAEANERAVMQVLQSLRSGGLLPGLEPLPGLQSILVGHSMGALMSVLQQSAHANHRAIALLGFSTRGLPEFVPPQARELAADMAAVRAQLVPLARATFVEPYPAVKTAAKRSDDLYGGAAAEPAGVAALKAAVDRILPVPAFLSMIPGNVLPEARALKVPVFIGVGERDMVGPPREIPASFEASTDITLLVLPETGHSHFLFASRHRLFDRLADWAQSVSHLS